MLKKGLYIVMSLLIVFFIYNVYIKKDSNINLNPIFLSRKNWVVFSSTSFNNIKINLPFVFGFSMLPPESEPPMDQSGFQSSHSSQREVGGWSNLFDDR